MKKRILFISVASVLFIGCVTTPNVITGPPKVSNYIGSRDISKYRKIAVLPFADAPNAPQSGQIVQGLASQIFAQHGFIVVERARLYNVLSEQQLSLSGLSDTTQAIRVGKLLGVNAIVVGEVGQYSVMERHTDTTYFGRTLLIPIPGKQWTESYVSLSLRVVDVETSQLIYSGAGQYDLAVTNPPQQLAQDILQEIIARWAGESYQTQESQQPDIRGLREENKNIFRSEGEQSSFAGSWAGTFKDLVSHQSGSLSVTVSKNNTIVGSFYNSTKGVSGSVSGTISNTGIASMTYTYPGAVYTATGIMIIDGAGHLVGNFNAYSGNTLFGTVIVDFLKQ